MKEKSKKIDAKELFDMKGNPTDQGDGFKYSPGPIIRSTLFKKGYPSDLIRGMRMRMGMGFGMEIGMEMELEMGMETYF